MQITAAGERIVSLWKNKRSRTRLLVLLGSFVLYALLITGIFAYYSSVDNVTNRISGKNIGLELYEPGWDARGSSLAKRSEPGMVIPKDPYAKNVGELDQVVRLKLQIRLGESTARLPSANNTYNDGISGEDVAMLAPADDTQRKIAILRAILDADDNSFMHISPYSGQTKEGNAITVSGADGKTYYVDYKGKGFLVEAVTGSGAEEFDFYFYYIGNNYIGGTGDYKTDPEGNPYDRTDTVMEVLSPREATATLFDKLVYPIYKKDYLTVFDQAYTINVFAEGILVEDFGSKPLTVQNFKTIANS